MNNKILLLFLIIVILYIFWREREHFITISAVNFYSENQRKFNDYFRRIYGIKEPQNVSLDRVLDGQGGLYSGEGVYDSVLSGPTNMEIKNKIDQIIKSSN